MSMQLCDGFGGPTCQCEECRTERKIEALEKANETLAQRLQTLADMVEAGAECKDLCLQIMTFAGR